MYNTTPIRSLNKIRKQNKVRLIFSVSQDTFNLFAQLLEKKPELNASQVVADAIRFAYKHGVYDERERTARQTISSDEVLESKKSKPQEREEWCAKYGGEVSGQMCKYTKYEITPTGHIVKATQALPIKQLPDTEDEFRKFLLGKFGTVGQAESAYQAQVTQIAEPEERTLASKMKKLP